MTELTTGTTVAVSDPANLDDTARRRYVLRIVVICFVMGLVALHLGSFVLKLMGVSIPATQTAGGIVIAILIGVASGWWFENIDLGVVIASALVLNMLVAGLAGVLVPLALNRLKVDPAIASAVFVTTVTDVIGFFAFLGLAAWWFGLL